MAGPKPQNGFASISETVGAFARGEFVIVLDSLDRENEGDLMIAADAVTTNKMAFMIRHTSGYVCVAIPESRANELDLPLMVTEGADPTRCAYSITVDGADPSISTGISAHDRALTCRTLADATSTRANIRRPGHMLPLRAVDAGVRARRGHTEAAVELCRLAGRRPAGVLCEMVLDGEPPAAATQQGRGRAQTEYVGAGMMRRDDCLAFGRQWGIKVCTIRDLVAYVEDKEGRLATPGVDY
ncbi:ethanolamine kinase [Purpureocillium lavendulum]|uniref:3,4-dihydroxy-2-butanone 4-phosphate synthase n=1 Tax=Purpureocillium lavendulum TaxID=1247861 RepID=A0AB34G2I1_9HYPO|nr:ethanolamine kinase [Purpureocillium lavendulum]